MSRAIAKCRHIKRDGSRCRANTRHGSEFCFFHDPASALARDAARKAGGIERSRKAAVLPPDTPNKSVTGAADVVDLLAETINQVRRGELDARVAYTIGHLAGILLKARHEQIEKRVERLERITANQSPTSLESELDSAFEPDEPDEEDEEDEE
jgi:hypothetical protein